MAIPKLTTTTTPQTGDEASINAQGYIHITGRIKDLIIKGGENIHPLEIENCLLSHPLVSEVSVVGLPNERYGEIVAAFIIPRQGQKLKSTENENKSERDQEETPDVLTTAQIRDHVLKNLSHHLIPKYIFWVSEYPKTASGKIQKFKLVQEGIELVKEGKGL